MEQIEKAILTLVASTFLVGMGLGALILTPFAIVFPENITLIGFTIAWTGILSGEYLLYRFDFDE